MYEVIKSLKVAGKPATMFRGHDAEGRTIYDVTFDRDGMKVEPVSGAGQSTQAAAIEAAEACAID